jgi:O-methyltransferase
VKRIKSGIQSTLNLLGFQIVKLKAEPESAFPLEAGEADRKLLRYVIDNNLSMVSAEGLWSTLSAAKYVCENRIAGDFVECGVWRGGNAIIAAEIFRRYGSEKKVFLYDTFSGMTEPTQEDKGLLDGQPAITQFLESDEGTHNEWCYASIGEVHSNFAERGLLDSNIVFVQGDVAETLKEGRFLPDAISILRLDTDFYESTKIELETLYPRLSKRGCIIVDDYGFWSGSKKATDEYFASQKTKPLFHVTDTTRRIGVKV